MKRTAKRKKVAGEVRQVAVEKLAHETSKELLEIADELRSSSEIIDRAWDRVDEVIDVPEFDGDR